MAFPVFSIHLLTASRPAMTHWKHTPIGTPYWRLYWNSEPGWVIRRKGQEIPLDPDRVVLVAPETAYETQGGPATLHRFVHFTLDAFPVIPPPQIWSLPCEGTMLALATAAEASMYHKPPWPTMAAVSSWCLHCIAQLDEADLRDPGYGASINEALIYLHRHDDRAVDNDELAGVVAMHPNAFIRRFKAEVGLTPQRYHLRRRIDRACGALLHSDDPIDEIAAAVGFADRNHFTRVFTRIRGIAPARFRREAGVR
ncbi:MAG: AraC family transcriptional regulator [Planctomycetota bacterium]|jgi:AraC-like DNA-binding protein|nr:AraC family transcriptional regulator [Planctomycetota bacterium]